MFYYSLISILGEIGSGISFSLAAEEEKCHGIRLFLSFVLPFWIPIENLGFVLLFIDFNFGGNRIRR